MLAFRAPDGTNLAHEACNDHLMRTAGPGMSFALWNLFWYQGRLYIKCILNRNKKIGNKCVSFLLHDYENILIVLENLNILPDCECIALSRAQSCLLWRLTLEWHLHWKPQRHRLEFYANSPHCPLVKSCKEEMPVWLTKCIHSFNEYNLYPLSKLG